MMMMSGRIKRGTLFLSVWGKSPASSDASDLLSDEDVDSSKSVSLSTWTRTSSARSFLRGRIVQVL